MLQTYCLKCGKEVEISSPRKVTAKNGLQAIISTCPKCGVKLLKLGREKLSVIPGPDYERKSGKV